VTALRKTRLASLLALLVLTACGDPEPPPMDEAPRADTAPLLDSVHFLIPGSAGGGWDATARAVGAALAETGLVGRATFENRAGGGGGRAIAHLIEVGDPSMLMVNSTPIVIRSLQGVFPQTFRDLTPVASVIGDYSAFAVRVDSPLQSLADLAQRQRAEPRAWAIGGGSVHGNTDHVAAALLVRGFGGAPRTAKYIPYDAGGKAVVGLLSGEVTVLSSGLGEVIELVRQGRLRLLCVASEDRLSLVPDVPTCEEAGAPGAVFVNWRGFFAAPGLPAERVEAQRAALAALVQTDAWARTRARHGWVDIFRPGPAFVALLEQQERVVGELMRELGMLAAEPDA
jgi:putative tricarboxylic transport membrane protein